MTRNEGETRQRILHATLEAISEQGIGKTSLDEVAYRAGVTRVTVYRHFVDKEQLFREAFMSVELIFQQAADELESNPAIRPQDALDGIAARLSALPRADAWVRADELKRLYPATHAAIQHVRVATLDRIFDRLFTLAQKHGALRKGLNRPIVQAVFWELVVNFFDNPRFQNSGLTDAELFSALKDILMYGIMKQEPASSHSVRRRK